MLISTGRRPVAGRRLNARGRRLFRFLITGAGACELTYFSQKGGTITQTVELVETPIQTPADEP